MSRFKLGRVILLNDPTWSELRDVTVQIRWSLLCLEPLSHNGFRLFNSVRSMSPDKYKQGKIKTQNV